MSKNDKEPAAAHDDTQGAPPARSSDSSDERPEYVKPPAPQIITEGAQRGIVKKIQDFIHEKRGE